MRIGIDLDGVVYDFVGAAMDCAHEIYGHSFPNPEVWDFPVDEWGMSWGEWHQFIGHATVGYNLWNRVKPSKEDVSALTFASFDDSELFYLTHRFPLGEEAQRAAQMQTADWLHFNHFPHHYNLHIARRMAYKPHLAKGLGLDICIEDNVENAEALLALGVDCVLLDRPWNRHASPEIARVATVEAFTKVALSAC